ncbi:homospermidine synthase [Paracraurococcus lichenis]|uniref:Saccharopine dehydrogenase C-terminal domain-containing protein n=1 Tax=Paracraurococcus lichenis TaxID=3064888 RepID=A0ABT9DTQ4_9PROT|nr:saccharopine dehydrogenase C-terminal domain-containing protein [Paracraurococcus sp. LOR1-02]MDO9707271.1 saccharopine dehydrogenase C-terminal domain-containing protein [Paracraurococcus sp. LOR1-02]
MIHATFSGRLVMLGFGSIGQGVLPLILRHIAIPRENIAIVTAEERGREVAAEYGITFTVEPVTRDNLRDVLVPRLKKGDFLLNLSVDVSSVELMKLCQELDVLYLDTVVEPWAGGYTDPSLTPSQRSNYAMREEAIALREYAKGGPTSITAHGANPGLVSHFVKQALLDIARDTGAPIASPPPASNRAAWARIAQDLGVKVIHIAERDTQVANRPKKPGEFVNTWSVDGFVGEGCQPAELGWGTHETALPADGHRHGFGCDAAIYLMRPGASTRVRTWTPLEGPFHGFLITHNESISLADYYTVRDEQGKAVYRPTAHYAYHPCDDAVLSVHELAGKNWQMQPEKRLMTDEIVRGMDELGVLLMGHGKGAYWYGSRLTIEEARRLVPHNNATSLQVTVAVLAGVIWAIENPRRGVVESDEIDHDRALEICRPYLGEVVGVYSDWTPLQDRGGLFPEDLDTSDPWQFKNIRVV